MDWKKVLADLRERGWTQKLLAEHCDVAQSSISALATGATKDPAHSLGEALKKLRESDAAPAAPEPAPAATSEAG